MKIVIFDGLPFVSATLIHKGHTLNMDRILLDTGSASTLLRTDDLETIGILPEPADPIQQIRGVGGTEFVFEKTIDCLKVGELSVTNCKTEIGALDYGFEINGILGFDLLRKAKAIVDLANLECRAL